MLVPIFRLDSHEAYRPVAVEASLATCGYAWDSYRWLRDGEPVDRIDLPSGLPALDGLEQTVYHRVVDGGSLWWHQFWTWWMYNPKTYAGIGAHEGDWELVQLGCRDPGGDVPILMTISQHDGGEKREFWRVSLEEGGAGRPVVYVARDSHANYFATTRDVTDQVDGKGVVVDPVIKEMGAWSEWAGKWGNSDNSPGPLSVRRAWRAPHAWHAQARG